MIYKNDFLRVALTPSLQEHRRGVVIFQYRGIVVKDSKGGVDLHEKGIGAPWMIDVMHCRSNNGCKQLKIYIYIYGEGGKGDKRERKKLANMKGKSPL